MSDESKFAESEIASFENFDDSSVCQNANMCILPLTSADSFERLSYTEIMEIASSLKELQELIVESQENWIVPWWEKTRPGQEKLKANRSLNKSSRCSLDSSLPFEGSSWWSERMWRSHIHAFCVRNSIPSGLSPTTTKGLLGAGKGTHWWSVLPAILYDKSQISSSCLLRQTKIQLVEKTCLFVMCQFCVWNIQIPCVQFRTPEWIWTQSESYPSSPTTDVCSTSSKVKILVAWKYRDCYEICYA